MEQRPHNICCLLPLSQLWFPRPGSWLQIALVPLPRRFFFGFGGDNFSPGMHPCIFIASISAFSSVLHNSFDCPHLFCPTMTLTNHANVTIPISSLQVSLNIFMVANLLLLLILVRLLVASSAYSCRSDGGIHGGRREAEPYLGIAG